MQKICMYSICLRDSCSWFSVEYQLCYIIVVYLVRPSSIAYYRHAAACRAQVLCEEGVSSKPCGDSRCKMD